MCEHLLAMSVYCRISPGERGCTDAKTAQKIHVTHQLKLNKDAILGLAHFIVQQLLLTT